MPNGINMQQYREPIEYIHVSKTGLPKYGG